MGKRRLLAELWHRAYGANVWSMFAGCDTLRVLCYHRIGRPSDAPQLNPELFDLTFEGFERELRWLKRHCSPVTLEQVVAAFHQNIPLPPKAVLITFDDGYRDNFSAAKLMASLQIPGVFFVCPALIENRELGWWERLHYAVHNSSKKYFEHDGRCYDLATERATLLARLIWQHKHSRAETTSNLTHMIEKGLGATIPTSYQDQHIMTQDEVVALDRTLGMTVGSHTMTHRVLATLPLPEQKQEMTRAKNHLEEWLGKSVDAIAYPVGGTASFTRSTCKLARECGYKVAFSLQQDLAALKKTDPWCIPRLASQGDWRLNAATIAHPSMFRARSTM